MNGAPLSMSVARLVANLEDARIVGPADRAVAALVHDSRAVQPGSAYVALPGAHVDGHAFVAEALAAGASTIVIDSAHAALAERAGEAYTAVVVPQTAAALSPMAATFYGNPSASLSVIGITGTNGKTTTAALVAAILDESGIGTGRIGTLGAEFRGHEWPLANTTPLALELQALLAGMKARGARAVAMEVSSHALALGRVADVRFACAVLTNVTRDHLDFHGTFEAYAAAKRRLFDMASVRNPQPRRSDGRAMGARARAGEMHDLRRRRDRRRACPAPGTLSAREHVLRERAALRSALAGPLQRRERARGDLRRAPLRHRGSRRAHGSSRRSNASPGGWSTSAGTIST